jgi:uncharacterized integral membrane protein
METGSNSTPRSEQRPAAGRIWTVIFVALIFVLLFLLGRSMVEHRFFRGGRVHDNGSIGQ